MTSINQYATRTFAEHPVALWPLDDNVSYISLIADSVRDASNVTTGHWAHDGTVAVVSAAGAPFEASGAYSVHTTGLSLTSTSPNLFGPSVLGSNSNTFHVGAYVKFDQPIVSYTVSCFYNGDTSIIDSETFTVAPVGEWMLIGSTFVPRTGFTGVQFQFHVEFLDITSGTYSYTLNGLSVGQRSEPTCSSSLGVTVTAIDSGTGIPAALGRTVNGSPVLEYGIGGTSGYMVSQSNNLLASNYGIPLVYGSDNGTRLRPSADETGLPKLPSIILPGMGIFNDLGKHNDYTFEAWLRVQNNSVDSRRIIGPLASNDGIYVKDGFISLVVGDQMASHPVSEWYRPMLLHIVFSKSSISMLLNGETVASVSYNASTASFPTETDWIGFYCYADTQPFEIDSISIFPYAIDATVARRKMVWGQGVEFPELTNSAFGGSPLAIDYAYSKFSSNFSYPDYAHFESGYADNLSLVGGNLSVPDYALPAIVTGAKTAKQLYADSQAVWNGTGPTFITFRADGTWRDPCYLKFNSLDAISTQVNGVYGIFSSPSMTGVQPLLHFVDKSNGNSVKIDLDNTVTPKVTYSVTIGAVTRLLVSTTVAFGTQFAVGVNFQTLLADKVLATFFNNRKNIQVYIGGNGIDTFAGNIYRFGLMSATDKSAHAGHFDGKGFATLNGMAYYDTTAYTLLPLSQYNNYFLDIAVHSYWEEYYPLSYFAAYTNDPFGNTKYDVDFLQFNIGVPSIKTPASTYFDTTGSPVYAFVTFQRISAGANKSLDNFTTGVPLALNSVVDARTTTGLATKVFEVIDNTVIYPPDSLPLYDTAIVLHLNFNVIGIKSSPLVLRNMSFISKSLDYDRFNAIGTKFGLPMYPYSKFGNYYTPKPENPYTVYKGSTPHLYLTDNSGVSVIQLDGQTIESGINIPVNAEHKQGYQMSAMQIWIKYSDLDTPTARTLFSVESSDKNIDFKVTTDGSDNRMQLTATDTGLRFYQDGLPIVHPYIERNVWTAIGIDFIPSLEFSDVGSINLLPGAYFNNVVYYKASALQMDYLNVYRYWEQVRHSVTDGSDIPWSTWETDTWDKVWKLSSNALGISIDEIYKSYVGTNRVVVDDNSGLLFSGDNVVMLASETYVSGNVVVTDNAPDWYSITRKPI